MLATGANSGAGVVEKPAATTTQKPATRGD